MPSRLASSALARRGDDALHRLEEVEARVPQGVLREERDSLRMEALLLAHDDDGARAAARKFEALYPRSARAARAHAVATASERVTR